MKCYAWRYYGVISFTIEHTDNCVPFLVVDDANKVIWGNIDKEIAKRRELIAIGESPKPQPIVTEHGTRIPIDPNAKIRENVGLYREQLQKLEEIKKTLV